MTEYNVSPSWQRCLRFHVANATVCNGMPTVHEGTINIGPTGCHIDGEVRIGGNILKVEQDSITVAGAAHSLAGVLPGRLLRDVVVLPPTGDREIDESLVATRIIDSSMTPEGLRLVLAATRNEEDGDQR